LESPANSSSLTGLPPIVAVTPVSTGASNANSPGWKTGSVKPKPLP
jgi:hypothetical protein